jgi:hypothetical protein|tara:strand:+ start:3019 stop:3222 length:204 start_codon:yes stop_codon:yes gene_type:complete
MYENKAQNITDGNGNQYQNAAHHGGIGKQILATSSGHQAHGSHDQSPSKNTRSGDLAHNAQLYQNHS